MIIDFRLRPPTPEFQKGGLYSQGTAQVIHQMVGVESPPSVVKGSVELLISEMTEAGITLGVIAALRSAPPTGAFVDADHVAGVVKRFPRHFVGFVPLDPTGGKAALKEIDRGIHELGLKGIAMDPANSNFAGKDRLRFNDPDLYFIYDKCQALGIPVVLRTGPLVGRNVRYTSPVDLEEVMQDFPSLNLVAGHGCWPYPLELIAVAWKHPNLYVSPDILVNMKFPGWQMYIDAANTILSKQMLFASAYPFAPLKYSVDSFLKLGIREDVVEDILWKNAARILNLPEGKTA